MQIPQENWLKVLLILCKLILQMGVRIDTYFVIPKMGALVIAYFYQRIFLNAPFFK